MPMLILFRHAKAEQASPGLEDSRRPLTERGRRDAAIMGKTLAGLDIDTVLVSTAQRTRETWEAAAREISNPPRPSFESGLYMCSTRDLLKRLREVPDNTHNLVVLGHNPTLHELALQLAVNDATLAAHEIRTKFPTAAMAIFRLPTAAWEKLGPGFVELERFLTP
jgi:phosphohistidine phosphatase